MLYAVIGIIGTVLIWRGVWHLADSIGLNFWLSIIFGVLLLLSTGLLVAIAIGDEVIITAFRGRKKINEMELEKTITLAEKVDEIKNLLTSIEKRLAEVKKEEQKIEKEISA